MPRTFTSWAATATSSSLIQLVSASAPGTRLSPDRLSFTWSTPYLRNMRTAFRMLSGPSTTQPKDISGKGRCGSMSSPSEPVTVISWLAARYRGPGICPELMASRMTQSRRGFGVAAPTQEVQP